MIYFQRGIINKLLEALKEFPYFKSLLERKIVAGESYSLLSFIYKKMASIK